MFVILYNWVNSIKRNLIDKLRPENMDLYELLTAVQEIPPLD